MESKILNCVDNDDVEGLKLLMDYPNLFQIEDSFGHTILQRTILYESVVVFNFLLSLDGCPINACNTKGETALEVALSDHRNKWKQHFVYSLLKKGADINCSPRRISSLLLYALKHNEIKVANFLIKKGADLNYQNNLGQTPLHMLLNLSRRNDRNELLAMMLYFGADLAIPDCDNYKLIDFAFLDFVFSKSMQEHLLFYYFDNYCTDYEIPIDNLFRLIQSKSPFVPQVLKHITSVNVDKFSIGRNFNKYFTKLFMIKTEYLKLLLEKFDYVIEAIIDASFDWKNCFGSEKEIENNFENLDLMIQSKFSSDIIQIINITGICNFINQIKPTLIQPNLFDSLMLFLLSYGANIYSEDIDYAYQSFGDREFFRILLHMDIQMRNGNQRCNIMPGLLYNIHIISNESLLGDFDYFKQFYSQEFLMALAQLLNYFAAPKLKHLCCSLPPRYVGPSIFFRIRYDEEIHTILTKVENLPSVPLLVELARNEVRKFLIEKYKIKNSMQFYTVIKHLPISKVHEKIITLETKLY